MISIIVFIFAVLIAFYIPGNVLLSRLTLSRIQRISSACIIGITLWAFQGYTFGFIHLRWATYVYLGIFAGIQINIWMKKGICIPILRRPSRGDVFLILLILVGVITLASSLFPFGLRTQSGFLLCCGDTRDNFLHLTYIQEVIKNIPPLEPGLSGTTIRNYHYGMHIVIGEFIRIFKLPLVDTTMRYFPVFLSLLFAVTALSIAQTLNVSKTFKYWLLFFLFFAGDFIYMTHALLGHGLSFVSYIHTNTTLFVNYPFGFSIVIALGALSLFMQWLHTKNLKLLIVTGLVTGFVTSVKVNSGFLMLSGLGILSIYGLFRKQLSYGVLFLIAVSTSALLLYPANSQSSVGLAYSGFWRVQDYIVQSSFGLSGLELARRVFETHYDWIKVLFYNVLFLGFYMFTVLGMKAIAFIVPKKVSGKIPKEIHVYLISGCVISGITGLFFLQNPGGANSMFFLTTALVLGSVYCALSADYWAGRWKHYRMAISVCIVCLTIPTSLYFVYTDSKPILTNQASYISEDALESFAYIKEHTPQDSTLVVLNDPMDKEAPYVHFFTERPTFLSGQNLELSTHGINFRDRQDIVNQIYQSPSSQTVESLLKAHAIGYIILNPSDALTCKDCFGIQPFFENASMKVLRVY